jgi:hypothetical protein
VLPHKFARDCVRYCNDVMYTATTLLHCYIVLDSASTSRQENHASKHPGEESIVEHDNACVAQQYVRLHQADHNGMLC